MFIVHGNYILVEYFTEEYQSRVKLSLFLVATKVFPVSTRSATRGDCEHVNTNVKREATRDPTLHFVHFGTQR